MADRVAYAVLPYRQGETWYAEVPDLDYTGASAATEAQALTLVQECIAAVRASYRQQGVAPPAPETRCVMLDVDA